MNGTTDSPLSTPSSPAHSSREEQEEREREGYMTHLLAHEKKYMGGFRRIYPVEGCTEDPYSKFFEQSSSSLCSETAASKVRSELARQQVFPSVCVCVC